MVLFPCPLFLLTPPTYRVATYIRIFQATVSLITYLAFATSQFNTESGTFPNLGVLYVNMSLVILLYYSLG